MDKYWRHVKVKDIKFIGQVGGRFGREDLDAYFTLIMNDGSLHYFHYDSKKIYEDREKLQNIFIEINNIPETYLIENSIHIEVDGVAIPFGYRVENNKNNYEYKTLLEIESLRKEGKIRDEGWRHLVYICPLKIERGKLIFGKLKESYINQLRDMGITIKS